MISDKRFNALVLDELETIVEDMKSGCETPNQALFEQIKTIIWKQLPKPLRIE